MPQRPSEVIQEIKTVFVSVASQKLWPAHPTEISLTWHCVSSAKMSHLSRDLDWNVSSPIWSGWSATCVSAGWVIDLFLSEPCVSKHLTLPLPPKRVILETEGNDGKSLHLRCHCLSSRVRMMRDDGLWEPGFHLEGLNPDFWCYLQMRLWVELQDRRQKEDGFCTMLFSIIGQSCR